MDVAGGDAGEHEPLDAIRVAGGVLERDQAAHGGAEQRRPLQLERVAERLEVRDPGVQRPLLRRAPVAPAGAARVEIDHLRHLGQRRADVPLVEGVVDPRRGRQENHGRALAHPRAGGRQRRAVDVEEELGAVDRELHDIPSAALTSSRKTRSSS